MKLLHAYNLHRNGGGADTATVDTDPLTLALSGTLQATVANHGAVTSGEFRVRVFADTDGDGRQGEDEPTLGATRVPSLAPDEQHTLALTLAGTTRETHRHLG